MIYQNQKTMSTTTLTAGTKVKFTPTGSIFEIAKVTDKNVSWYVGFEYKGGSGKNTLKMACTSLKRFLKGIENGAYEIQ